MTVDVSDLERRDMRAGYKRGIRNGKRLAQRKSEWPKSLSPPSIRNKWYQAGYELGIKHGKRRAKGKSQFPQSVGHPKALSDDLLVLQFIKFVDAEMIKDGISRPAAVSRYRKVFGRAWKKLTPTLRLDQEQLLNLYKRKTKPGAISDHVYHTYIHLNSLDSPAI